MKRPPNDFIRRLDVQIIGALSGREKMRVCELEPLLEAECRTIRRWLREMAGMTISEYIHRLRLEVAALLLRGEADLPMRELCALLGLKDGEKFCKRFKAAVGFAPSVYRRLFFEENREGKYVLRGGVCFKLSAKKDRICVLRSREGGV